MAKREAIFDQPDWPGNGLVASIKLQPNHRLEMNFLINQLIFFFGPLTLSIGDDSTRLDGSHRKVHQMITRLIGLVKSPCQTNLKFVFERTMREATVHQIVLGGFDRLF